MIALDATYSVGPNLSGVGVYSREILFGLAKANPEKSWDWFFRSNRYFRARELPENVRRKLLWDGFGSRRAELFHGLNQRLPQRRFRRQVATFHDLFVLSAKYSTPEFRERFAAQARHAAEAADLLIAVSQFTANQVEEYLGIPQSRIRVVPHGVLPRPAISVPREKIVLCVGAIQRRKNQAALVRAFRAMPECWKLVLAGAEGFESRETLDAVAESPSRQRIRITGYVTDSELAGWYSKASIFAFPSLDEGFGIPVLEAMAAGIPVVAANCAALPEVCGGAAILIDPKNEDELAEALMEIASNGSLSADLAAKGVRRAKDFPWSRAVNETAAVYRQLLSVG